ncbi:MAG TPA: alpha-L-arabinofuranosidase C-terminal domain-containing protein [Cyclobacteriaceae bacterium]|nr:alpha-L-arabinofuranosidase C-terminal domain-containing protein [Cyclobacteriaceae bacterium]
MKKIFVAYFLFAACAHAQTITVAVDKPKGEIQPTMWGIFFEDINFAADGGVYAELVKNRSFEFLIPTMGWKEVSSNKFSLNKESGSLEIINRGEGHENNPRFARVKVGQGHTFSIINEGFFGMGVRKDLAYNFSIWMQGTATVKVELIDDKENVIGSTNVSASSNEWKKYTSSLTPSSTFAKAKLRLTFSSPVDIDQVSLMPGDTWNGLRKDLVQLLADLKPGFLRFPGGCIVEGRDLATRYQWKKTVGNVDDRELMINRWNTEFAHRQAPDYFQSFGLGFYEYFLLSEHVGATPLPILGCGMACQFNTAELAPMDELDPYIQDALDLIEFANGSTDTKWGKLRADMGHPATFNMKLIGVGNEQWGTQYFERYYAFEKAIHAKYPDILIVSSAGPFADGELFDYAWGELRASKAQIVDEHYYQAPDWFFKNTNRYDNYDRKGPKIFAGEYAAQSVRTTSPENKNNWLTALSEAAFMTGLERNADVVHLASYAPLFAHAEGWQWTPDLIWFDNLNSYGTPNYYVQKLFSINKGTHIIPTTIAGAENLYASAVLDKATGELIVKIVNSSEKVQSPQLPLKKSVSKATLTVLKGKADDVNTFQDPSKIVPVTSTIDVKGKLLKVDLAPLSLTVIRIKL